MRRWLAREPIPTCPHPDGHARPVCSTTVDRITKIHSLGDPATLWILADGNEEAYNILVRLFGHNPLDVYDIDVKRLYGERIVELFRDICGSDLERFVYHLTMELPHQDTGRISTSGKYSGIVTGRWLAARQCGEPGSFWALANPPQDPNYEFPIR